MKTIQILLALSLMMGAQACETEIPETDVDPPTFSIKITGDGFDETFYQDTNFDRFQLNLREGAEYTFLISGGDTGGLKRFEVYFAPDYIQMNPNLGGNWARTSLSGLTDMLYWTGNASSPLTGTLLNGTFIADGDLASSPITFYLTDFGGSEGSSNITSASLNVYSGDHATEIKYF
ncbi:MAG: hypothetical protein CML05_03235 [Pseudozobellia sp.]|nr:hypothetical protein [Pseudozobellia sp.]|tara:strand:+ start:11672 stop:12202 length:531 start_codon:yes stop_codon:yes gene_type:complete